MLAYGASVLLVEDVRFAEGIIEGGEGGDPVENNDDTKGFVVDMIAEESVVCISVNEHAGGGV